jgi:hypothetical protein
LKQTFDKLTFTRSEVSAFREISKRSLSITELAADMGRSTALASHIVKSLQGKGLVETRKMGMRTVASVARSSHAQLLSDLLRSEPSVPWEELLSYSAMVLLLDKFEGLNLRDVSRSTRWRAMRNLAAHGILSDASLVASNAGVRRFLDSYAEYVSRVFASQVLPPDAVVIWSGGYRYLFRVERRDELKGDFTRTAVSALPSYGIQLVTKDEYYFYAKGVRSLTLEDALIHTLLIDQTSQTYATYALLAIFKNRGTVDFDSLVEKAEAYGIRRYAESIKGYVDSKGASRVSPLPRWADLREQASVYGVDL